jgi:glyoxylase-like metal-dependent hydrolase (beta-lactamase superfamily II)
MESHNEIFLDKFYIALGPFIFQRIMKIEIFKGGHDRNASYLVWFEGSESKGAFVIDPFQSVTQYFEKAGALDLKISGVLNTHKHIDHVAGNLEFEKRGVKIIENKGKKISFGNEKIELIKTPGHSDDCVCFYFEGSSGGDRVLFTGDVLFAGRVGMTRGREESKILFKSLKKLIELPDETLVYPGHHYNSEIPTTIGAEKKGNAYLKFVIADDFESFEKLMAKWRDYMREKKRVKE